MTLFIDNKDAYSHSTILQRLAQQPVLDDYNILFFIRIFLAVSEFISVILAVTGMLYLPHTTYISYNQRASTNSSLQYKLLDR